MRLRKNTGLLASCVGLTMMSTSALASVEANIGVTSNYLWRGVTQSNDGPSVSGGIDYSHESGFYAGTWLGTVEWSEGDVGTENDFYLGYSGESGDFGYDVGYVYYYYPKDSYADSNFGELYFNGSYQAFSFGLAYTINSDVDDDLAFGTGDLYYSVGYGFDLPEEFSLGLTYGYYDFDSTDSGDDYGHFQIDLSKGDFTLTVSKAEDGNLSSNDTQFAVSWGTSF